MTRDQDVVTATAPALPSDNKVNNDVEYIEEKEDALYDDQVVMKSPFEDLGFWDTMWRFRKSTFMALVAAFSAAAEYVGCIFCARVRLMQSGYQIGMTGNIIASKGFIKQYGADYNAKGDLILKAGTVSAWGGVQSAGQGFGMITMHLCVPPTHCS